MKIDKLLNKVIKAISNTPNWVKRSIPIIGTCAMLALVFGMVDWREFLTVVSSIDRLFVIIAFLSLVASIALQGVKLWVFLRYYPLSRVVRASMTSYLFFMLPGGTMLGPAVLVRMLQGYVDMYQTGSTMVIDIVTKFLTLLLTLLMGLCLANIRMWDALILPDAIIILLTVFLLALISKSETRSWIVGKMSVLEKYSWGKSLIKLCENLAMSSETLRKRPMDILAQLILGMLSELMYAVPLIVLSGQLGISVQGIDLIWISCLVRILSSVPLTVGGLGVREAALLLILTRLGISKEVTLSLSLVYTSLNILSACACALLIFRATPHKSCR